MLPPLLIPPSVQSTVLYNQAVFLVTGLFSTLGQQWLHYQGAADARSMLTILVTYLGMSAVYVLPDPSKLNRPRSPTILAESKGPKKRAALIAVMDVGGNLVLTAGSFIVGSGLYQVIYASIVGITAIFSYAFLGRNLTPMGWICVGIIMIGMSVTALGSSPLPSAGSEHNILFGFGITLFGTCIYAGVYTINDYLLSGTNSRMTPRAQCFWVGFYSTLLTLAVIVLVSIPTLRTMPLSEPGVIGMYLALIASSLGHNVTYFQLLESTGAVATGVLQALRAVLVFGLSHLLFCKQDAVQCFTAAKGVATLIVVAGVIGFSVAKAKKGLPVGMASARVSRSAQSFELLPSAVDDDDEDPSHVG
ncbi:hypothetical protein BDZ88DRAFT_405206 [Geranomyces variabilis]|nr:hypothetical protein BDZ88DRAFT_405206 [Geranomyces variabilis]KAJ3138689.1 hypothetical protein HDU90_001133 [Geranomyces variabilis]